MKPISTCIVALIAATSQAAEFRGITAAEIAASFPYELASPVVRVTTISGDGAAIGGSVMETGVDFDCAVFDCANTAFVWTHEDSSRRSLGELSLSPGTLAFPKTVSALSFDASAALVTYEGGHYETGLYSENAATALRDPIVIGEWLWASDMAPDASVVVGSLGEAPFRWTEEHGFEGFAGVEPDSGYGATAISADKSTTILNPQGARPNIVVGFLTTENALRWTAAEGAHELSPLDGFKSSRATALSSDGSIVVGASYDGELLSNDPSRATVWIDAAASPLEAVSAYSSASSAEDVSADGRLIVGSASGYSPFTDVYFIPDAVLWKNGSAHILQELLATEYGLGDAIEGWNLTSATAISDDGTVIAGEGIAPDGSRSAWVAILTVPEPKNCILAAIASLAMVGTVRGRFRRGRSEFSSTSGRLVRSAVRTVDVGPLPPKTRCRRLAQRTIFGYPTRG